MITLFTFVFYSLFFHPVLLGQGAVKTYSEVLFYVISMKPSFFFISLCPTQAYNHRQKWLEEWLISPFPPFPPFPPLGWVSSDINCPLNVQNWYVGWGLATLLQNVMLMTIFLCMGGKGWVSQDLGCLWLSSHEPWCSGLVSNPERDPFDLVWGLMAGLQAVPATWVSFKYGVGMVVPGVGLHSTCDKHC